MSEILETNAAANTEEVAAPLEIDNNNETQIPEGETAESNSEQESSTETKPEGEKDFTETQAFSQRLNEMSQKKIDAHYEKLYGESNNVHSEADYIAAMEAQTQADAEEERRSSLEENGYDPSVIDEYVSTNPAVVKAQQFIQQQELEKFKNEDNVDFLDYFQKENKRPFDANKDILPNEVWDISQKYQKSLGREGRSLKEAYQKHENTLLKAKIAEFEKGTQTNESNSENAANSTGSVTGNGKNTGVALTDEMVQTMTPLQLSKRWNEVRELYKMK
jgi:hypothetical protein